MRRVLEEATRFDRSMVWRMHNAFFHETGLDAWDQSVIPEGATSNRARARAMANLLVAVAADVTPEGPVRVLEVGCGAGTFAINLFRALREDLGPPGGALADRLVYLLSDFVAPTVEGAIAGPELAPLVSSEAVLPALFDLSDVSSLRDLSGAPLEGGFAAIVCNYVACTMPARHFLKREDGVYELHIETAMVEEDGGERLDPGWSWRPASPDDPFWTGPSASIVAEACIEVDEGRVSWPTGFLGFLEVAEALVCPGGLLLVSDYGTVETVPEEVPAGWRPTVYGQTVNAGMDFRVLRGIAAHRSWHHAGTRDALSSLHTMLFGWHRPVGAVVEQALRDHMIDNDESAELLDIKASSNLAANADDPRFRARLLRRALKIVPRDPELHLHLGATLLSLGRMEVAHQHLLAAQVFDTGKRCDVAFEMGRWYGREGRLAEALQAFETSLARSEHPLTFGYIALVHEKAGRVDLARAAAERALAGNPALVMVKSCLERLNGGA